MLILFNLSSKGLAHLSKAKTYSLLVQSSSNKVITNKLTTITSWDYAHQLFNDLYDLNLRFDYLPKEAHSRSVIILNHFKNKHKVIGAQVYSKAPRFKFFVYSPFKSQWAVDKLNEGFQSFWYYHIAPVFYIKDPAKFIDGLYVFDGLLATFPLSLLQWSKILATRMGKTYSDVSRDDPYINPYNCPKVNFLGAKSYFPQGDLGDFTIKTAKSLKALVKIARNNLKSLPLIPNMKNFNNKCCIPVEKSGQIKRAVRRKKVKECPLSHILPPKK
jgi:hypothetical protein